MNLAGHVRDKNLYSSIDVEVYGDGAMYLCLYWDVQHCVETYMLDMSRSASKVAKC